MKIKSLLCVVGLICSIDSAYAQSLDKIFGAFSQCDSTFFKALKNEELTVKTLAPTSKIDDALWFAVPSRKDEVSGTLKLTGNPTIAGLPVVSYVDHVSDLELLGKYYTWGFNVRGELTNVVNALHPLIFDNHRLRKDDDVYVRTELKTETSSWLKVNTAGGTVPKPGTVERAFLIEPTEDRNLVMVTCSLQGSVLASHLKELRPDFSN